MRVINVAVLAAGLGTRMKSRKAKVLHQAGGLPVAEHVVRAASAITQPDHIVVVVGHQADKVREALTATGAGFVEQHEQKGTGHALLMCREALESKAGYVVVLYGDCPLLRAETLRRLVEMQEDSEAAATLITTHLDDPTGYGRIVRNAHSEVVAIVEQKAARPEQLAIKEVNTGIYCFRSELLWDHLSSIAPNAASGEIYLTDMVEKFIAAGGWVQPMLVEDPKELLGINTRVELAEADRILRDRKSKELMLAGVTIEKPETVTIDMDVTAGMDTVIEPFAQILGKTQIGEDCRIGTASIVRDSVLGDRVDVGGFTFIGTSTIGADAHVGPYARLRQDNVVGDGAHIGNFVELKKTRMGKGSKANHLAYLGDSVIGEKVNVGAGTITCNYDGRLKHQTTIGNGVFVGSNSTLVAPVEIGDGSYVAAGSVITEAVAEDTLALGRAHQVVKPGWPSKRRAK